ncbi:DUF6346 domain-containing protein [Crossiella sp. CA-258035]|uniref:DUF6346 domain-containing protein n=1 Tax=Crossiella sp. CA-258035 TaxID=2981138 RepID=UPI0024BC89B6|nr:DUF6346 domain-containing protein [Crossiella sp. CA-258035]WHT18937.1 DUF6346 domain-containing protein [Crossiella sp. CA-258035]
MTDQPATARLPRPPAVLFRLGCAALLGVLIWLMVLVFQAGPAAKFHRGAAPAEDDLRTGTAQVEQCARVDRSLLVTELTAYSCPAKVRWDSGAEQGLERETVVWSRHDISGRRLPVREGAGSACQGCPDTTVVPVDHPKADRGTRGEVDLWVLAGVFLLGILAVFPLVGMLNGPRPPRADGRKRRLARHVAAAFVVYLGIGVLVGGILLLNAVDFQAGVRPGAEVRATGTATVEHCRRADRNFLLVEFTRYECPAQVRWRDGALPPGHTKVESLRELSGQVEVRSAKVSCGRRCVGWVTVPADHPDPSGAVRWWVGFGQIAGGLLLIGLVTGAVLAIYRIRPTGTATGGTALPPDSSESQGAGVAPKSTDQGGAAG